MGLAPASPPSSERMAAQRGALTAVTASAPSVAVGGTLTVTASGTNPCGAAHINYGDGIAITYAISALPTSQTHVYQKPGTYAIVARGMGNCDGEATTRVEVTSQAPAPPPEVPNTITAIEFVPRPGVVRQPVAINVSGRGTCAFTVTFGDGNQQELNGPLPQRVSHTYAVAQTYTVIVAPAPPCAGKFSDRLQVAARGGNRITGLAIDPMPADVGRAVTIDVEGAGACAYRVDYGDGNGEDRSKPLPDRLRHVYNTAGSYVIRVEASGGCAGRAQRTLDVR
ncbi:MAG TPA: hypothetical protein VKH34_12150 [Vicinamibacterales bacterium]|nr:hypothetical protein [Vicinamibacterales bacterium]